MGMINNQRLLELVLRGLESERARVEEEIRQVKARLGHRGPAPKGASRPAGRKRRRMSPAARKAVSERMRAYWAKRKETGKGKKA